MELLYHTLELVPSLSSSRHFSWSFHLAPVSVPNLSFDFLHHHALLVDAARGCVLDADSLDVLSVVSSSSDLFCAHLQTAPREIRQLLSEYPDILSFKGFSASTLKHSVFHDLSTVTCPPVFIKAHPFDPDKLASAHAEFLKMEKTGIVCKSSSQWYSPLLMVAKP